MKCVIKYPTLILLHCCIWGMGCHESPVTAKSSYNYISPVYTDIQLVLDKDTLNFPLSVNSYNEIKSFNYFKVRNTEYVSFYDARAGAINIYDLSTQVRIKKIKLKKWLRNQVLYKTSVYVQNFDSILITNQREIYLFDSLGTLKINIAFKKNFDQFAFFDNTHPAVLKNNILFTGVRPWVSETSFKALQEWKMIYGFDLKSKEKSLYYSLPETYQKNLYGFHFLDYNYCINEKGNFVFSFPADTCIYETNLDNYHTAYYGKSLYQTRSIQPVSGDKLKKDSGYKEFCLRDSYGAIYYDAFNKRYLRLARQKISEKDYLQKSGITKQSIIIFDKNFKIIGEQIIDERYSYNSMFFTGDGQIYVRVNFWDENALHFVRLNYVNNLVRNKQLTKN